MSKRSPIGIPAIAGIVAGLLAVGGGAWYLKTHHPAPSAPQVASAGANINAGWSREQAASTLMALPELQAWGKAIEKSSAGKMRGGLIEYDPAPRDVAGAQYYQFTFVENSEESVRPWQGFLVSIQRGDILVEDDVSGELLTLDRWRQEKQPLQRASAQ